MTDTGSSCAVAARDLEQLACWARSSVRHALGGPRVEGPRAAWAAEHGASFVTLRWAEDGRLQGCIGSIEPRRPLRADVAHNAVAAALSDPRALPLRGHQVDDLDVEVSILSPLSLLAAGSELEAAAALRPRVDGVVLGWRGRRATLLPSVWDRLEDGRSFLSALRDKAGMPDRGGWEHVTLWRYTVARHVDRAQRARPA